MTYRRGSRYTSAAFRHIVGFGHSGMAGGGTDDVATRGWGHLLAAMLGATYENYARGGAAASFREQQGSDVQGGGPTGSGGWAWLIGTMSPNANATPTPYTPGGGGAFLYPEPHVVGEPYLPPMWVPLMFHANNDLGFNGNSTRSLNACLDAMRTIISRLTASAVYEESSSTCAFGTAWPAVLGAGSGVLSGNDGRALPNSATNQVLTISVPADFRAGDVIALGFTLAAGATGSVTVAVDGSSAGLPNAGVVNFASRTALPKLLNEQALGIVYRIGGPMGGLAADGAHTITVTPASSGNANVYFDYWQVEPGAANGSAISALVPSLFKPYTYGIWPTPLPTDADVDNWNASLSSMLAAEFPAALYVDISSVVPRTSVTPYWWVDQTHPSNLGHAIWAATIYDAINNNLASKQTSQNIAFQAKDPTRGKLTVHYPAGNQNNVPVTSATFVAPLSLAGTPLGEVVLPASPGDLILVGNNYLWNNEAFTGETDVGIMNPYLTSPSFTSFSTAAGSLAAGTYFYWLTGSNAQGETVAAGPLPVTIAGASQVVLHWAALSGASGSYKVYRTTTTTYPASGTALVGTVAFGTNTFTDNNATATATFPPTVNKASGTLIRFVSGSAQGTVAGLSNGIPGTLNAGSVFAPMMPQVFPFVAQPGDISTGQLILRLYARTAGTSPTRNILAGAGANGGCFWAENKGRNGGFLDRAN